MGKRVAVEQQAGPAEAVEVQGWMPGSEVLHVAKLIGARAPHCLRRAAEVYFSPPPGMTNQK